MSPADKASMLIRSLSAAAFAATTSSCVETSIIKLRISSSTPVVNARVVTPLQGMLLKADKRTLFSRAGVLLQRVKSRSRMVLALLASTEGVSGGTTSSRLKRCSRGEAMRVHRSEACTHVKKEASTKEVK